jgi:trimeric autotransporter adhesin
MNITNRTSTLSSASASASSVSSSATAATTTTKTTYQTRNDTVSKSTTRTGFGSVATAAASSVLPATTTTAATVVVEIDTSCSVGADDDLELLLEDHQLSSPVNVIGGGRTSLSATDYNLITPKSLSTTSSRSGGSSERLFCTMVSPDIDDTTKNNNNNVKYQGFSDADSTGYVLSGDSFPGGAPLGGIGSVQSGNVNVGVSHVQQNHQQTAVPNNNKWGDSYSNLTKSNSSNTSNMLQGCVPPVRFQLGSSSNHSTNSHTFSGVAAQAAAAATTTTMSNKQTTWKSFIDTESPTSTHGTSAFGSNNITISNTVTNHQGLSIGSFHRSHSYHDDDSDDDDDDDDDAQSKKSQFSILLDGNDGIDTSDDDDEDDDDTASFEDDLIVSDVEQLDEDDDDDDDLHDDTDIDLVNDHSHTNSSNGVIRTMQYSTTSSVTLSPRHSAMARTSSLSPSKKNSGNVVSFMSPTTSVDFSPPCRTSSLTRNFRRKSPIKTYSSTYHNHHNNNDIFYHNTNGNHQSHNTMPMMCCTSNDLADDAIEEEDDEDEEAMKERLREQMRKQFQQASEEPDYSDDEAMYEYGETNDIDIDQQNRTIVSLSGDGNTTGTTTVTTTGRSVDGRGVLGPTNSFHAFFGNVNDKYPPMPADRLARKQRSFSRRGGEGHNALLKSAVMAAMESNDDDDFDDNNTDYYYNNTTNGTNGCPPPPSNKKVTNPYSFRNRRNSCQSTNSGTLSIQSMQDALRQDNSSHHQPMSDYSSRKRARRATRTNSSRSTTVQTPEDVAAIQNASNLMETLCFTGATNNNNTSKFPLQHVSISGATDGIHHHTMSNDGTIGGMTITLSAPTFDVNSSTTTGSNNVNNNGGLSLMTSPSSMSDSGNSSSSPRHGTTSTTGTTTLTTSATTTMTTRSSSNPGGGGGFIRSPPVRRVSRKKSYDGRISDDFDSEEFTDDDDF